MKLIERFFTFRLSFNVVKDIPCVFHVYGRRRRCHGNMVFAVDAINIVVYSGDISNKKAVTYI